MQKQRKPLINEVLVQDGQCVVTGRAAASVSTRWLPPTGLNHTAKLLYSVQMGSVATLRFSACLDVSSGLLILLYFTSFRCCAQWGGSKTEEKDKCNEKINKQKGGGAGCGW